MRQIALSQNWLRPVLRLIGNLRCNAWDFIHGVDTCGDIPLVSLDFQSANKTAGLEYQSHHPAIIREALRSLKIRHERYTLIDFGCGKGRVLLVAAEFPFHKIIGLEFAPQLAEIARRNLSRYRLARRKCRNVEAITADATEFELPPETEVLYFYSPFAPETMDKVMDSIERSWEKHPRDLLILFSGVIGVRDRNFGLRSQYERLQRRRYFDVYRHR